MALTTRNLNPFNQTVRPRTNLHIDLQDAKPVKAVHATIQYVLPIGTPVVYDIGVGAWLMWDGNSAEDDLVTIRGFTAKEVESIAHATETQLIPIMLRGKISFRDIPRLLTGDGSVTLFDKDGGNALLIGTEAELIASLQGVAPGGGGVPETTLRELGITVTDVALIR